MTQLFTPNLVMAVNDVHAYVEPSDREYVLQLIESGAQAEGDLGVANQALYARRELVSQSYPRWKRALDVVFYRGMAGYLVRPFHPILALLVIAALATFLRFGALGRRRKAEAQPGTGEQIEPAPASRRPEAGSVRAAHRLGGHAHAYLGTARRGITGYVHNLLDTLVLIGPGPTPKNRRIESSPTESPCLCGRRLRELEPDVETDARGHPLRGQLMPTVERTSMTMRRKWPVLPLLTVVAALASGLAGSAPAAPVVPPPWTLTVSSNSDVLLGQTREPDPTQQSVQVTPKQTLKAKTASSNFMLYAGLRLVLERPERHPRRSSNVSKEQIRGRQRKRRGDLQLHDPGLEAASNLGLIKWCGHDPVVILISGPKEDGSEGAARIGDRDRPQKREIGCGGRGAGRTSCRPGPAR